jgi:hypothetical protein
VSGAFLARYLYNADHDDLVFAVGAEPGSRARSRQ